MTWRDLKLHAIDFEGNRKSGIVEFGMVSVLNEEILATHTRLCRSVSRLEGRDTQIHGIRQADVEDAEGFQTEWERFSGARREGVLCAHHAIVEDNLLRSIWPYPPFSVDPLNPDREIASWGPWIDTRRLYEVCFPTLPGYGLEELIVKFKLQHELEMRSAMYCPGSRRRYHCALYDAMASWLLLQAVRKRRDSGHLTLRQAVEWSLPQRLRSQIRQNELFD